MNIFRDTIQDRLVQTRKDHQCAHCLKTIRKGGTVRFVKWRHEGDLCTAYFHPSCLFGVAKCIEHNGEWHEGDGQHKTEVTP